MNGIVHRARVVLIETGKQLPFVLCLVVAISYAECAYALYFEQFVVFDDCVYLKNLYHGSWVRFLNTTSKYWHLSVLSLCQYALAFGTSSPRSILRHNYLKNITFSHMNWQTTNYTTLFLP